MNNMVQGFLDNDSFFGRFMTKLGIIIAANIMFVLLSIPFFTIGAGFSALYYVMFRTLRNDGVVNPFKEFWTGLRMNFKQATITWILFVLLIAFLLMDIRICNAAGGTLGYLKIGVYAIGAAAVILYLYLIPVMTVFEDSLPNLIRNTVYFLCKKPLICPYLFRSAIASALRFFVGVVRIRTSGNAGGDASAAGICAVS